MCKIELFNGRIMILAKVDTNNKQSIKFAKQLKREGVIR